MWNVYNMTSNSWKETFIPNQYSSNQLLETTGLVTKGACSIHKLSTHKENSFVRYHFWQPQKLMSEQFIYP